MTVLGHDTFSRANQSGWGTASDTQVWVQLSGAETLAIASNEGTATGNIGVDNWLALGTTTAADQECRVRFKFTNQTNDVPGVMLRSTAATTAYRVRNNGGLLGIRRVNAGVSTTVGTDVSFAISNNTFYWIRAQIIGSTINARMWADGNAEPSTWTLKATDTTPISGAGRFGLYSVINTTATDVNTFDSFTATTPTNDIATRFRLAKLIDIATSFRLSGGTQSIRDIASRFRLMQQSVKDVASRVRLMSANQLNDVATRFRLMSANQLKDIASRFRLAQQSLRDVASRFRLMQQSTRDVAARFRLMSANQLKDVRTRFRLMSAGQLKDVATRFRLTSSNTRLKDITCRFVLSTTVDLALVSAFGRDGKAMAQGRDARVSGYGRDGIASGYRRDGHVLAYGRDARTIGRGH